MGLGAGVVRMSPDRFGGTMGVGRHRAHPFARTRESECEPQAPRKVVNSQMDDGVWTKRRDIEQHASHLCYPTSHQTRAPASDAADVRFGGLKAVDGNRR